MTFIPIADSQVRKVALMAALVSVVSSAACNRSPTNAGSRQDSNERAIANLRNAYAAFNRGDMDAAVGCLDPEIDWTEPPEFPGGRSYHGREEVKMYLTQSRAGWIEGTSEPEKFLPAGNRIVVFVRARFRAKGNSDWEDVRLADVYTIRDGVPVQMRAFARREEALRWVGLPAQTK